MIIFYCNYIKFKKLTQNYEFSSHSFKINCAFLPFLNESDIISNPSPRLEIIYSSLNIHFRMVLKY